jgi:beta-lactamase regulating signal transducer with metallopeptidase domain
MGNIFLSILGISVSIGLIVIGLIFLTPFLNKRYAAKWKYLIWIFLALRLLIPFSGANGQDVMDRMSQLKVGTNSESEENDANNPTDTAMPYRGIVVEIPAQMTTPIKASSEKSTADITMLDIVTLVWIIGSLIFIFVHLISYSHYKRQVLKNGKMIKETRILSQIFRLKRELHISRTVCVMEYDEAESPMIIGFIKPVLVLPKEQYNSEDLFFILKHELVHFKRGDVYLKLLFVTANAVHWFNPIIWIMQKEAVIDMELSCDERVTQGTSFELRKAYTETLLSMLHKQCVRKTVLSTQFYGGKKIMRKRFKNILIRNRKKNGISILICAVVLSITLGMLVGCSVTKENTEKENIENEDTANEDMGNVSEPSGLEAAQTAPTPVDNSSTENNALENTITLTFSKEGEQEQKQATLAIGNGYSFYLPDDEKWHLSAPDLWTTDINEQIALWVTHFEGESVDSVNQKLEDDGYTEDDSYKWWKQEGDLLYHAEQKVFENNIWVIFYSYPVDFQEGWGREFPVIVNTFALSDGAENGEMNNDVGTGEYLGVEDCQKIRTVLEAFAESYFNGDVGAIQKFLASTYEGEVDIYEGTGMISDLTVKGLSDTDEKKVENGKCNASIEFRDSNYEDMFLYLTFILVKEQGEWKIQFYGMEG